MFSPDIFCDGVEWLVLQALNVGMECHSVGRALDRYTAGAGFDSSVPQGIFLPESALSTNCLYCVCALLCAIACINIFVHVKYPVVHGLYGKSKIPSLHHSNKIVNLMIVVA